jgi:hypothetical protein
MVDGRRRDKIKYAMMGEGQKMKCEITTGLFSQ